MKIRSLALENFRKFRAPMRLSGFTDGLNMICEANEFGKSTLLEAMRAALFERHGAKSEYVRSFRPWGDETAPAVELAFELRGEPWVIRKRFLQAPRAVLVGPSGQTFSSDEAEERLQALLGFERSGKGGADAESRGVLGMLWIEQGDALRLMAPGRLARETIESVLAGEVGAVTGGRRAAAVALAVEGALKELRTLGTGQPTGRLLEAQKRFEAARARVAAADATLRGFGESLDRLQAVRSELVRLERDLTAPEHAAEIKRAQQDLEIARAADGRLREAKAALGEATSRREGAERKIAEREGLRREQQAANGAVKAAEAAVDDHAPAFQRALAQEADLARALVDLRADLERAEADATKAQGVKRAARERLALAKAFERLDGAEGLVERLAALRSELDRGGMSQDQLEALVGLEAKASQAQAALQAGAATLDIKLNPGAEGQLNVDGRPAHSGRIAVVTSITVEIAGIGSMTVSPGAASGVTVETAYRRASEDLAAGLAKACVADLTQARAAAERRRALEADLQAHQVRLETACPADPQLGIGPGVEALWGALQGRARPSDEDEPQSTLEDIAGAAEARLNEVRSSERRASAARDAAGTALKQAELEQLRRAAAAGEARARLQRANVVLEQATVNTSDDMLTAEVGSAREVEARAAAAVVEAERSATAFDLADLQRRIQHDEVRRRNLLDERTRLAGEIGRLEQIVLTEGQKGPAAELADAQAECSSADEGLRRISAEADALSLLRQVLAQASRDAARVYLEPVTRHMAPYVSKLLPDTTLELTDSMSLGAVSRAGRAEPAQSLSRGTQEQLAVLTRLAFADLLLEKDKPVSLVLDDALVFSDDARLEVMTEIITGTAKRLQVTLMTCRKRAFLHLDATRIHVEPSAPLVI